MTSPDDALVRDLLRQYMDRYSAFRLKPVGAPYSEARFAQERDIMLEDNARAALAAAEKEG